MDTIIDHIMQFLQFDVASVFGVPNDSCLCCMRSNTPMDPALEKFIENVYEPRPEFICDSGDSCSGGGGGSGDYCAICCEEPCDDEITAVCEADEADEAEDDYCEPCLDEPIKVPSDDDDNDGDCEANTCDDICKQMALQLSEKCSSATMLELQCIEERAVKLWETLNAHMRPCTGNFPNWWDLKAWQKLPFYWAALSNEILCDEPFENFKRFTTGNRKPNKRHAKRQHERLLITWHGMNSKQRLPFVMEAFISKVGSGRVSICDEHEIQRIIGELQAK